jgi:hypothetical protein
MEIALQLLTVTALATAEFCAAPFDGGVGEPQFCRISERQEVSTPYFSIVVEPEFIVGVHNQGRRLQVQSTLWQSPNTLIVERIEGSSPPEWPECPTITETIEGDVTWLDCRIPADGFYERRLAAKLKSAYVVIEYTYSRLGAATGPALERMLQSVRIHAI